MKRYILTALALKAFSLNRATKWAYRRLGNRLGKRADLCQYLDRGNLFLDLCDRYHVIRENDELLELGTGWLHWYSVFLRLHFTTCTTMFDVWDNRQFQNLLISFHNLKEHVEKEGPSPYMQIQLLERLLETRDFDELYELLDLNYVMEPKGSLTQFADSTFDCVFSADVLEHISESSADQFVDDIHRILKPGGYSLHYIACDDHLAAYDSSATPKSYLSNVNLSAGCRPAKNC